MTKKANHPELFDPFKLEVSWKQVFPEDADLRIQRAFEMLLNNESTKTSKNQLKTLVDKGPLIADNKINEKEINKITHSQRSSWKIARFSTIGSALLKSEKA